MFRIKSSSRKTSSRQNSSCDVKKWLGLALFSILHAAGASALPPELPRRQVNTQYTLPSCTQTVSSTASLQAAFDGLRGGETLCLPANVTYRGNFILRATNSTLWTTIRTTGALPGQGARIAPAQASNLPKLVTNNSLPALALAPGAGFYRIVGIEVAPESGLATTVYDLVTLGTVGTDQDTVAEIPHDIIVDRCYIHGSESHSVKRGIALNSSNTAVINSYVSDIHVVGQDNQAIAEFNSPGPLKIQNNFLEAATENVLFGGADPTILNLVPEDVEILDNVLSKKLIWDAHDPSWNGSHWAVKNLFELKHGRRILVSGNLMENNWIDGQDGTAIVLKASLGDTRGAVTEDISFVNNVVRRSTSLMNASGPTTGLGPLRRVLIKNNVFEDIADRLFVIQNGAVDIAIVHNTAFHGGNILTSDGAPNTGFVYTDNISRHNLYGVIGGGFGIGRSTLDGSFSGYIFRRNILAGGNPSLYPSDNFFPTVIEDVQFVDLNGSNYALAPDSIYRNAATDGTDVGADTSLLNGLAGDRVPPLAPSGLTVR